MFVRYDELVPWQHYIPFREDVSDLERVLQEARANASRLEYIAGQASRFVMRRLNPSTVACYWALLLREYETLFTTEDATEATVSAHGLARSADSFPATYPSPRT